MAYRAVAVQASYSHRTLFGAAFAATAVALGGTIDEATADEAVDRQYRATIEEAVLRPDCLDTLAALRRSSIHVQIVSNIDDEQFEPMLERLGPVPRDRCLDQLGAGRLLQAGPRHLPRWR